MWYNFDIDTFNKKLQESVCEGSIIIHTYLTAKLKIPYGFIKTTQQEINEITCFTESDSILEKKIIKYKESWQICKSENEEEEIKNSISCLLKEIEESEDSFASPCSKKLGLISYRTNPPSFDTWVPKFTNPRNLLKWIFTRKRPYIPPRAEIDAVLEVKTPAFSSQERGISFTWLGHATILVRLNGINIITDPVFGNRASFISFAGPKRLVKAPCEIRELPDIDIVVLSHDHHDHLEMNSLRKINARNPNARWFVPLGIQKLLKEVVNIEPMTWGQEKREKIQIKPVNDEGNKVNVLGASNERNVVVTCIPSQHWCARAGYDLFSRLWSGWMIAVDDETFYYAGDTGFCKKEFLKVGMKFQVSLAAIPIGCYEPSWFMHPQHISPVEAVAVHEMVKAKKSVAVHWGTYNMGSSEGFLSPGTDLLKAIAQRGLEQDEFMIVPPGLTTLCSSPS